MPTYEYRCGTCNKIEEHIHRMSETPEIKCSCGEVMSRMISFNAGGFIIRGGSEAINWKEKRHRMKSREEVAIRQRERYGDGPKIKPNIAGVETESWSDARKMAKEAGMNHESFTPYVEKEKSSAPKIYTGR